MYAKIARYFQAERCDMSNNLQQRTTSAGVFSVCLDRLFALSEGMDMDLVKKRKERSEEHTSELQSLMRLSYAVFCLKKRTLFTVHQLFTSPLPLYACLNYHTT